ncbi:hypothetical protein KUH32_03345 [Thalassococcus sp. CAU 1522]|uniref:Lipoprotein n=1 Tax=Thalassococcus arenae TaxID=2851652 RepID=A0ABS6N447_9RHOB|nr:hypothetical protein [Thalassococcus arenae]MBV2358797.1 hypothetical protein [Thalassococcus arenae]
MRGIAIGLLVLSLAAGCGDALDDVPKLADLDVPENAAQAEALAAPAGDETAIADAPAPAIAEDEKPRRGLLGFLRARADAAQSPVQQDDAAVPQDVAPAGSAMAEPAPDAEPAVPAATEPRRGGLFAALRGGNTAADSTTPTRGAPPPGAPDYEQVGPGVTLPYGQIARLCGTPVNRLGREVGRYPERGRGYVLYDTAPGSTAPHTFFVTGFDDGCARQFTAALALFGSPEMHEQLRYGAPSKTLPVSETDAAYETIKSRVCRVGEGRPCGARMSTLARDTAFLSVYERFGDNVRWKNILLHDGKVAALDIKSK